MILEPQPPLNEVCVDDEHFYINGQEIYWVFNYKIEGECEGMPLLTLTIGAEPINLSINRKTHLSEM